MGALDARLRRLEQQQTGETCRTCSGTAASRPATLVQYVNDWCDRPDQVPDSPRRCPRCRRLLWEVYTIRYSDHWPPGSPA
jgi:hypothetical protein